MASQSSHLLSNLMYVTLIWSVHSRCSIAWVSFTIYRKITQRLLKRSGQPCSLWRQEHGKGWRMTRTSVTISLFS